MFKPMRTVLLGTVGATALLAAPAAFAQDQAGSATVEEIIVTAQKRSENLQDVPMAVSAFGQEQIREQGIESAADLATVLPGVKFAQFAGTANIAIRGVGTTIVSGSGEGSVALHLDGIFLPSTLEGNMAQEDLGGIEVLRGPQSTLYGRNATGGVINFISAAPTNTFEASATVGVGNYDYKKAEGYVSGPLGERVRGRLFLSAEKRDGYTENVVTGQDLEDLEGFGGRISVDADMTETWTSELRLTYRRERSAAPVYDPFDPNFSLFPAPLVAFDARELASPVNFFSRKDLALVSLKNSFELTDAVTLTSLTGYSRLANHSQNDALGTVLGSPLERRETVIGFSQEFNLAGSADRLDWLTGAYYLSQLNRNRSYTDFSTLGLPDNSVNMRSERTGASLFADVQYAVTERLSLVAGARALYERTETDLTVEAVTGGVPATLCSALQSVTERAVTGRLGVNYDLQDDVMLYGQYARGYKAGGFSYSNCNNPYDPETIDAFEAGVKSRLLDGRLVFNAAVFYYAYRDLQLELATASGIPVDNADKAHVLGADFDLTFIPADSWQIGFVLSLLDAQYDEFINADPNLGVPVGVSLEGIRLNNAPPLSGTLSVQKDIELASLGSLRLRGEVFVTDEYNLREFNTPYTIQDGYTSLNFTAVYKDPSERYEVRAWVKNATDETIRAGALGFGGAFGTFQPPRFYGIDLTARF